MYGTTLPSNPEDGEQFFDTANNMHYIYESTNGLWWAAAFTTSTSTSTTTTSTSTTTTSTSTTTTSTSTSTTSTSTTTTV